MRIEGLSQIAGNFGAMLVDQFGVIHDGQKLYPGTLRCLSGLKELGIPVAVMTNSGKRAKANRDRLVSMGVPRERFVDAVSSGEVAFQTLSVSHAFLIGRDSDDYGLDGVTFVDRPEDAQAILILGSNAPRTSLADYQTLLRGLTIPAICCNPDKLMLTPQGLQPAPGAIAQLYEEMGGQVTWIGKPYALIYQSALKLLDHPARTLVIGDSAEHDVAGGKAMGLATLLIMTGVSQGLDPESVSPQPDYWMDSFRW